MEVVFVSIGSQHMQFLVTAFAPARKPLDDVWGQSQYTTTVTLDEEICFATMCFTLTAPLVQYDVSHTGRRNLLCNDVFHTQYNSLPQNGRAAGQEITDKEICFATMSFTLTTPLFHKMVELLGRKSLIHFVTRNKTLSESETSINGGAAGQEVAFLNR